MKAKLYLVAFLTIFPSLFLATSLTAKEVIGPLDEFHPFHPRFHLGGDCQPMALLVHTLTPQTITEALSLYPANFQLENIDVETAVRNRLHAAHVPIIKPSPSVSSGLSVFVRVVGETFEIDIRYRKRLIDPISGEAGLVKTWELSDPAYVIPRAHNGDPEYILYWVSKYTDKFIDEYKRVNGGTCANQ